MARDLSEVPAAHITAPSAALLLKSMAVLLMAAAIAATMGHYTMKEPTPPLKTTRPSTATSRTPSTALPTSPHLRSSPRHAAPLNSTRVKSHTADITNSHERTYHTAATLRTSALPDGFSATMSTPIDKLSNTQIKEELRTLYAVTDYSDCIEPGDLQRKLQTVRDTKPITYGLRYGVLLELGNKKNPTGVVSIGHGLGDSAHGWEDVGYELARRMPYLLFLLPSAPSQPVTINGGMAMPAWYDITRKIGDGLRSGKQDAISIQRSCDYVRSLSHVAVKKYGIPPQRVVYTGFSQGAAIALSTGLTSPIAPAGIACLSGYLAAAADVVPRIVNKAVPITIFHGRQDPIVPLGSAYESKAILEECGVAKIDFREYNMEHSAVPQEIDDLAAFISRVLPERF